ncbi:sulfite exporter TauE/SafE family protein [Fodinibius sp.]|uniref:sulfite exporter TauE/SafE family protein n=1 Tax=Fodinibius sp. TaxID=1872440 RepID=UPI002ACD8613|nr:sulfite exporter TauE/SafE family protein [Fodinibius sp.]MDZ7659383.1 sulfite exporter TauE/SafE family protein [Fodinibius sp.]
MSIELVGLLTLGVFIVSILYSSVGHAGASGYIAVMSLFNIAPEEIKPAALSLNILVAIIGFLNFYRAGHFSWKFTWPFVVLSIPAAFAGGYLNLPADIFEILVGAILLFSAVRFLFKMKEPDDIVDIHPSVKVSSGAGIGFLAGLTGTGGGIFLTPFILLMKWAPVKATAAASVVFILVNSIAGLAGNITATTTLPTFILPMAMAVMVGGFAGSYLGSKSWNAVTIKRALSIVLFIAGIKLIFT